MRAWRIVEHGPPSVLRLEEIEEPAPGPGEALVAVDAVALNHLDLWVRRGVPGHRFPLPITPGCDVAGTVLGLGGTDPARPVTAAVAGPGGVQVKPGDRVLVAPGYGCGDCPCCRSGHEELCRFYAILGETRDGGCAERIVVPASLLIPSPANLTLEESAALPLALLTAWHMVVTRAALQPGETILVHAAGSGVGVMAIQIARMLGARVLATTGSAEKALRARELGAEEVIPYREIDFLDEVRKLTGKRGVDVVVEHSGGEVFEKSVRALAKGGRLVTCGATSEAAVEMDLRVVFFKSLSILGSTMGNRAELDAAMRCVAEGKIRPIVASVFPISELPAAHAFLEERRAFGKVVMRGFAG
jgi:NADPH:quinone reductase-like Zn-dependent oxidoreductase